MKNDDRPISLSARTTTDVPPIPSMAPSAAPAKRYIHLRLKLVLIAVEAPLFDVLDYADDFVRPALVVEVESFTDRIFLSETLLGNISSTTITGVCSFIVLIREEAAFLQFDLHRRQISGFDDVVQRHVHFVGVGRLWLTINPEVAIVLADHWEFPPANSEAAVTPGISFSLLLRSRT